MSETGKFKTAVVRTSAALLALGICFGVVHAEARMSQVTDAVPVTSRTTGIDLDIGTRGFVVVAWIERKEGHDDYVGSSVFARVKPAGDKHLSKPVRLGTSSNYGVNVETGSGDLAVVSWSGPDGVLQYRHRRPGTRWSPARPIGDSPANYALLGIGLDGTIVAADAIRTSSHTSRRDTRVRVSIREPDSWTFSPWRIVSGDAKVGYDLGVVAGTRGRGTVAWSGTCPTNGDGNPAYYVDFDFDSEAPPAMLENSKCAVWDLELQNDRWGRQYLKIGTWTGLRLATRRPGEPFPLRMTSVTNSYARGHGDLSVSQDGHMTLIWSRTVEGKGIATAYRYVTMHKGSGLSKAMTMKGPRMNPDRKRDFLLDSAPLPGGGLFNLWSETWKDPDLRFRHRFGVREWMPRTKFVRPKYRMRIPRLATPLPATADTASDGSRLAWWIEENDRGEVQRVQFTSSR